VTLNLASLTLADKVRIARHTYLRNSDLSMNFTTNTDTTTAAAAQQP
jgi:hypothetical protein